MHHRPLEENRGRAMSISMMNAVWQIPLSTKLTPTELNTLLALADRANDDGLCWPGQMSLADKIRISKRQLIRVLHGLADRGLIQINHRAGDGQGRQTNVYRLLITCEQSGQSDKMSLRGKVTSGGGQSDIAVSPNTSDKPSVTFKGEAPKGVDKEAWDNWHQYRMSREALRKSWGPQAQKIAATRLRELTPEMQRRCVEDGIQAGWKGIYPDKYKKNGAAVPQSAPKRQSAIQTCRNPNQLAALCQAAGIGLPPPGMDMESSKVWAMRKLGASA